MPLHALNRNRLRKSCEAQIDRLGLPYRFSTRELRDAITAVRGKPIVLRPLSTLGAIDAPCGIRLELAEADVLFYEQETSVHHRRHILTHELCHVYCDHPGSLEVDTATAHALGINPTLVMRMSGRTSYLTEDEREAEMMATIIRQRMYRERVSPSPQPEKGTDCWDALFSQPIKTAWTRSR